MVILSSHLLVLLISTFSSINANLISHIFASRVSRNFIFSEEANTKIKSLPTEVKRQAVAKRSNNFVN